MSDGQLYRGDRRVPPPPLGALELVALSVAAVGTLGVWLVQLAVVPRFVLMFHDFGGELPLATKLVVRPLVAAVTTLVVATVVTIGAVTRSAGRPRAGAVLLVVGALVPVVAAILMVVALYLPIFVVAGQVR